MQQLVKNGRDTYPGANFLIMRDGRTKDLGIANEIIQIQPGDIVQRHLVDGLQVIFNRQPSLHKYSMMSPKIKVVEDDNENKLQSFGVSIPLTNPYNADFDGDEMNMFVPTTIESQRELEYIMAIPFHIISAAQASTNIGLKFDSLLGCWLITQKHIKFTRIETLQLLGQTKLPKKMTLDMKKKYFSG